ncbi:L,D-transpeptidase family protein, partial [Akkermansiaceae bacterium]|nr:L,D-transpeptidase family protein [Akkermansiaceae bacterium]
MKALLALPLATIFLSSCGSVAPDTAPPGSGYLTAFRAAAPPKDEDPLHTRGYWDGDGVKGASSITIMRDEQKAYFYKGNHLVGMSPIATGKTTHTTPAGNFKITQKNIDHKSSLYGVIRDTATG